ncbi:MAG: hypothetical protein V4476_22605 [Pseudomonadota bacterium]
MQIPVISFCTALALAGQVAAAPVIAPLAEPVAQSRPALLPDAIVITAADPAGFDAASVPAAKLAGKRAGADAVNNDMQLNGAVNGNTAVNVYTGANAISSGSFSNASGLPVAIQNSGANVLIQNATIINIQMK